jgi:hypothetical protein
MINAVTDVQNGMWIYFFGIGCADSGSSVMVRESAGMDTTARGQWKDPRVKAVQYFFEEKAGR